MDAQPAVLSAVNSGVDSCEPLHKVGRELRAGWSHTNPGEEEHEHFAALWAAMEFRLQDGTWDVVLGPFRSTDHNGDLVSRAVGEMAPAVFEAWAAYAPRRPTPWSGPGFTTCSGWPGTGHGPSSTSALRCTATGMLPARC
ncbi:hypothetical protein [Streptomyces atratus]|uniref:hypothetical protein n=1 Tax=Streptomyces atratus TaxID=1893 RepID=UPI00365BE2A1